MYSSQGTKLNISFTFACTIRKIQAVTLCTHIYKLVIPKYAMSSTVFDSVSAFEFLFSNCRNALICIQSKRKLCIILCIPGGMPPSFLDSFIPRDFDY